MNDISRSRKMPQRWSIHHEVLVEAIAAAASDVQHSDTAQTRDDLTDAVDAARRAGVGWTKIGDTLGIASGLAYQRYRKRPVKSKSCDAGEPRHP